MTDQTGMFGNDEAYGPDESDGGRDKKTLLLAGGLAALVLGGGAFFLLGSGGGDESSDAVSVEQLNARAQLRQERAKEAADKAALAASTTKKPAAALVPAEAVLDVGRNPFTALYVEPVPVVKSPATSAPTTPTTVTPTKSPIGTVFTPPPGTSPTVKPTAPAVVLHKLVLQSVSGSADPAKTMGTFLIDSKTYVVKVGQVFGPKSEIVVVSFQEDDKGVWTATLQVGDSAPFDAAVGDELNVM